MYSLASRSPRCNATRRNVPQVNTCCTDLVETQYICPQTTGPLRIFTGRTELQILQILTDSPSSTDGDESGNDSVSAPLGRESNTGRQRQNVLRRKKLPQRVAVTAPTSVGPRTSLRCTGNPQ